MALLKIDFRNHSYLIVTIVAYIARADIDWGFKPQSLCMMNFFYSFFPKKTKTPVLIVSVCDQGPSFPPPIVWPTVHPAGQEQSPVMWWHVPPFWQGQLCSQWKPWLPEGHRSPQLSPQARQESKAFFIEAGEGSTEEWMRCWYSQSSWVPRWTDALSCHVEAGSTIKTLAGQLTCLAIVTVLTGLLTTPSLVPVSAHAGSRDGVTLRPVLALTPVAAVRSPVVALAACRHRK